MYSVVLPEGLPFPYRGKSVIIKKLSHFLKNNLSLILNAPDIRK